MCLPLRVVMKNGSYLMHFVVPVELIVEVLMILFLLKAVEKDILVLKTCTDVSNYNLKVSAKMECCYDWKIITCHLDCEA